MSYLPASVELNLEDVTEVVPSYTYRLDLDNRRVMGKVDGQDAVLQAIQKVFLTFRYAYPIYDSRYGEEFTTLIGKSMPYAKTEVKRMIEECLLQDDRILKVYDFVITEKSQDVLEVTFKVDSIFSEITYTTEVILA